MTSCFNVVFNCTRKAWRICAKMTHLHHKMKIFLKTYSLYTIAVENNQELIKILLSRKDTQHEFCFLRPLFLEAYVVTEAWLNENTPSNPSCQNYWSLQKNHITRYIHLWSILSAWRIQTVQIAVKCFLDWVVAYYHLPFFDFFPIKPSFHKFESFWCIRSLKHLGTTR